MASLAAPYTPEEPLQGPIMVRLAFFLPPPKGWPLWRTSIVTQFSHDKRPDIDNLVKLVMDALDNGRWWRDDGQIAALDVRKRYSMRPRTEVQISTITQPSRPIKAQGPQ